MAAPRLTGALLKAARALAEAPATRGLLWRIVSADFGVETLLGLPASALGDVEELPRPVAARPPRDWGHHGLAAATSRRLTAARLREAYASGAATPADVAAAMLDRLDRAHFGASTHSPFVALDTDGARAAATQSTERWRQGSPLGPLDGIPVPVKDEFHQSGLPTRGGTIWRSEPQASDAVIVQRLRDGGAVLPGKSHATENGLNPLGFNPHFDMPRNVYSAAHGAGGSSTGSAVAVGLGLAPVAIATDGGGSIRVPAAMNGLFGLKPTLNRLSRTGDIWRGTVGHAGPIGASVTDLVDLLEVCAAPDPLDPFTQFAPDWNTVIPTWRTAIGRGIRGCRIGVLHRELAEAEPEIAQACERALKALEAEGAVLVEAHIEYLDAVDAIGALVITGESLANARDDFFAHRSESSEELRLIYALIARVDAQLHLRGLRARTGLRERAAAALADVDLLAMPTHQRRAAPYSAAEGRQPITDTAWTSSMVRFNFLGNLTGLPAGTAPVGMHEGLPMGLQLMGDAWDEASVIAALAHLERLDVTHLPLPESYQPLVSLD